MASKTNLKSTSYGVIRRGNSLTIPVLVKDIVEKPIDLTGAEISFTVKKVVSDFDRDDHQAYIQKDFEPQEPTKGQFYILLSSKDTDFEPGSFFFDIEITKLDGMVFRICTLEFTLQGGPTNRTVNSGMGQMPVGDQITLIALEQGNPIVIIAPPVSISAQIYDEIIKLGEQSDTQSNQIEDLNNRIETLSSELQALVDLVGTLI